MSGLAERYKTLSQKHAMRSAEAEMLREQLNQTDRHQLTVDAKNLKDRMADLTSKIQNCVKTIQENQQKVHSSHL